MVDYDILGNIAVIKGEGKSKNEKVKQAKELMKRPSVKTVVEKVGNVKGRLRTIKINHILGEKNLISDYKENNCKFKFNISTCYFSGRLSGERKIIAEKVKMKDRVLVMFAGIGVFPIVIYKYSKPSLIVGVEIGKDCYKHFKQNLKINKIPSDKIKAVQGDVKRIINDKFIKDYGKFDVVVMARPNLKASFLEQGLKASKKGTRLFYYTFCNVDEIKNEVKSLVEEGKNLKRKLKVVKIVKAGDIAPYKYRYRIEFKVID